MLSFDITDRNIRIIKGTESNGRIRINSAATLNLEEEIIVNGHVRDVPRLELPVFFLAGAYDYTCCSSLQQKYYEAVSAPDKAFFLFEDSAHSPLYEEHERGRQVLEEIVRRTRS